MIQFAKNLSNQFLSFLCFSAVMMKMCCNSVQDNLQSLQFVPVAIVCWNELSSKKCEINIQKFIAARDLWLILVEISQPKTYQKWE